MSSTGRSECVADGVEHRHSVRLLSREGRQLRQAVLEQLVGDSVREAVLDDSAVEPRLRQAHRTQHLQATRFGTVNQDGPAGRVAHGMAADAGQLGAPGPVAGRATGSAASCRIRCGRTLGRRLIMVPSERPHDLSGQLSSRLRAVASGVSLVFVVSMGPGPELDGRMLDVEVGFEAALQPRSRSSLEAKSCPCP